MPGGKRGRGGGFRGGFGGGGFKRGGSHRDRRQRSGGDDYGGGRQRSEDGGGGVGGGRSNPEKQTVGLPKALRGTWNKITITNLREFGRDKFFDHLLIVIQGKIHPVMFRINMLNGDASFFIEDSLMAQSIVSVAQSLTLPNGQNLAVGVVKCDPPYVPLNLPDVEAIKKTLESRYDAITEHLNLSSFIDDAKLNQTGNYLSLTQSNVMMAVVNMLGDNYPNLKSIDLTKNRLRFLYFFASLSFRCPYVERLLMPHNMIEDLNELDSLFRWNLIELDLNENPVCEKFRGNLSYYVVCVRQILPKLNRLDGSELPSDIDSMMEDYLKVREMPPILGNCVVDDNSNVKLIESCEEFIKRYFAVFDCRERVKRKNLSEFYDDDAVFSMSASNLRVSARTQSWSELLRDSHNIKLIHIWRRYYMKLIQNGAVPIATYFSRNFPLTKHDLSSFIVDVTYVTDSYICVNVSGLYKDRSALSNEPQRYFTRVFVLISKKVTGSDKIEPKNEDSEEVVEKEIGEGENETKTESEFAIVNDELFVSVLGPDQETYHKQQVSEMKTWTVPPPETEPDLTPFVDDSFNERMNADQGDDEQSRTSGTKRKRDASGDIFSPITAFAARKSLDILRKYVEENSFQFSENVTTYLQQINDELTTPSNNQTEPQQI